jgi:hypothetical protein
VVKMMRTSSLDKIDTHPSRTLAKMDY